MSVRYTYLALEDDHQLIAEWFSALPDEKTVNDQADRLLFYFREMATHPLPLENTVDPDRTPLVLITKPKKLRGTIWTDAEAHFTPTPLKPQFPALHKISQLFARWLRGFDLVFSQKQAAQSEFKYYLEAGIQSFDAELYALPSALKALRAGQYFVHHRASPEGLNTLAKSLRLRGYDTEDS